MQCGIDFGTSNSSCNLYDPATGSIRRTTVDLHNDRDPTMLRSLLFFAPESREPICGMEALTACAGVTLRAVATSLGIEIRGGSVRAEGDLDFRGTLAVDRDAPVGFSEIRLSFDLDTEASDDELATLLKLTERYCVVFQSLASPPRLEASVAAENGS